MVGTNTKRSSNEYFHVSVEALEPPKIAVVVTGPFSEKQYALTKAKITVRVGKEMQQ